MKDSNPQFSILNSQFSIPAVRQFDNGLVALAVHRPESQAVSMHLWLLAGNAQEPVGVRGRTALVADLLTRGTAHRSALEIAEILGRLGAHLVAHADSEGTDVSALFLSQHAENVMGLLGEVVRQPTFPDDEFEKLRGEHRTFLLQEREHTGAQARRRLRERIFPSGHPYWLCSFDREEQILSETSPDHLREFHRQWYRPHSAICAVVGNLPEDRALALVEEKLATGWDSGLGIGDWGLGIGDGSRGAGHVFPVMSHESPVVPDPPMPTDLTLERIEMPDKAQADVAYGFPGGLKRSHEDFYAATIMNMILGGAGALGSRLGDRIRDELGLVYGIQSKFRASLFAGEFSTRLGTDPGHVDRALEETHREMKRFLAEGATQEELDRAIRYVVGAFPVRLETHAALADMLIYSRMHGLGDDYIHRHKELFSAVTREQVLEAARSHLRPGVGHVVIAGA